MGCDGVCGGLLVAAQDALAGTHATEEDGEVADEGVDTLTVLREEVAGDARRQNDVLLEGGHVEEQLVRNSDDESDGAVRRDPADDRLNQGENRRKQGKRKEEVPVHAVLALVLGVVKALDHGETDETETDERDRVTKGVLHAGGEGFLDASKVFLELLARTNDTGSEDEGADTEIHEGGTKSLGLAETAREDGKVDGEDTGARDDHHGTTVAGDEGLDGERISFLGLVVLRLFLFILVLLCEFSLSGFGGLRLRLQVSSNGRQKEKASECLRRVRVDGSGAQDGAALQEEVREIGRDTVRSEEVLPLLQDTPRESGNLFEVLDPCSAVLKRDETGAYRSQESQDVDLPDAAALQVGDGRLLLLLVVGGHVGNASRRVVVVRREEAATQFEDFIRCPVSASQINARAEARRSWLACGEESRSAVPRPRLEVEGGPRKFRAADERLHLRLLCDVIHVS